MIGRSAPLMLGGFAVSLGALVLVVLLLAWHKGPGPLVTTLPGADEKAAGKQLFPADFGRLADLVPFAGGVNPVATAVVPMAHGPEFRDREWVNARPPESWTLQVLASQDEAAVKRFLSGLEDRADYVYFAYPKDGQNWFVVTSGSYSSREQALGVADAMSMPDGARPFPRAMGAYQEALAAAAKPAEAPAAAPEAVPAPAVPPAPEPAQP